MQQSTVIRRFHSLWLVGSFDMFGLRQLTYDLILGWVNI